MKSKAKDKKFYETKEFQSLKSEWDAKLKASGFVDVENKDGSLKQLDRRTIAFPFRDKIVDFHSKLGNYLSEATDLPDDHRRILELYNEGTRITGAGSIKEQTGYSDRGIRYIISRYKTLILNS